ncbi:SGNH/GDSL hydrolase family protein [Fructilactobacillus vespulae]|uniref:SGNH/GDSL hydrolase family protein n=1 Tax=Fructilactobacillus vespulae TaxID=1249630 RepID=UPI0039B67150
MNKHEQLIMLGDSITNGFDGHVDLEQNISYYLNQLYPDLKITNAGVNAGQITGTSERDLPYQVEVHDFAKYDVATIAYGTNDFAHAPATLEILGRILQQQINEIKAENPAIKILGILPINRFDGGIDNYKIAGLAQYTFQELLTKLTDVYQANQIPVLNWRKLAPDMLTVANYPQRLGDQRLHPNAETYQRMAQVVGDFLSKNV